MMLEEKLLKVGQKRLNDRIRISEARRCFTLQSQDIPVFVGTSSTAELTLPTLQGLLADLAMQAVRVPDTCFHGAEPFHS